MIGNPRKSRSSTCWTIANPWEVVSFIYQAAESLFDLNPVRRLESASRNAVELRSASEAQRRVCAKSLEDKNHTSFS